jgi:hypothetical protein
MTMPSSISSSESSFPDPAAASRRHVGAFAAVFAVLLLTGAVATEWLVRVKVVPNHSFYKHLALFQTDTRTDAAFGDSQVSNGFTGAPGFVNLGYPGDDFVNMDTKVRLYFAERRPGRVVIQAGLNHFSYQFVRRVGRDDALLDAVKALPWLAMTAPWHRIELIGYWKTFLTGGDFVSQRRFQEDGSQLVDYDYADHPPLLRRQEAARLASQWAPIRRFQDSSVAKGLDALLDFLQARGAKVCLVTMPLTPEVVESMRTYPAFEEARDFMADLAAKKGIAYLDLRAQPYPDHFYADRNHLNAAGASVLTATVTQLCFASPRHR